MRLVNCIKTELIAVVAGSSALAQIPPETQPKLNRNTLVVAPIATAVPGGAASLDKADASQWLDGFMPFALARGNIAGAVVKDGKVLDEEGYGFANVVNRKPVDPETTLFSWAALGVVLFTAISWPARALARRRYVAVLAYQRRRLQACRLTNALAWAALLTIVGWAAYLLTGSANLSLFGGPLDWLLRTLQILSPIAFFGLAGFALWTVWLVWTGERGWFARLWSALLALSALVLSWVALGFHLIGFGTRF